MQVFSVIFFTNNTICYQITVISLKTEDAMRNVNTEWCINEWCQMSLAVNFYDDINLLSIYYRFNVLLHSCVWSTFSVLSHVLRHRCLGARKSWFSALQNGNKIACFEGMLVNKSYLHYRNFYAFVFDCNFEFFGVVVE